MSAKPRPWISPRKERDHALAMGEQMACIYERHLGRPLTPAELRAVHQEARRIAGLFGRHLRKEQP